jgi:hypothetical protein
MDFEGRTEAQGNSPRLPTVIAALLDQDKRSSEVSSTASRGSGASGTLIVISNKDNIERGPEHEGRNAFFQHLARPNLLEDEKIDIAKRQQERRAKAATRKNHKVMCSISSLEATVQKLSRSKASRIGHVNICLQQ